MVTARLLAYSLSMPDIGKILGQNFKAIRVRHAGTQEKMSELTGLAQGRISELENAKGWKQIANLAERLQEAGINPMELFAVAEMDRESAELIELVQNTDVATKTAILTLLRGKSMGNRAAS